MRILIVEDEPKIADSLKKGLEQESFVADVAYDGNEGLSLAEQESYNVIVLDRMLPGMDGLEICQKLRDQKIDTPVLMLTARAALEDRVEGLNTGADDYLVKPFAFTELVARVRALARRPNSFVGNVLQVEDLSLDTTSFTAQRDGKNLELSKREFALLEFLMRHVGRIVTKDQIMNQVWSEEANVLPNTVEVYFGYLRNKIEKPFPGKPALLHTVRGFGYRMG